MIMAWRPRPLGGEETPPPPSGVSRGILTQMSASVFDMVKVVKRAYKYRFGAGGCQRRGSRRQICALVAAAPQPRGYRACPHSRALASRAPSAMAASLAQVISGSTVMRLAKVAKPQSVPAMTFWRPTRSA
jgi:hypothetical protein